MYTLLNVTDGSSNACRRNLTNSSATITVNPLPTATISGNAEVCRNATAPLITFTGANATAPYTFTAYTINGVPNQTVTTTTGNSVTVSAPTGTAGTFVYTLVSVRDGSTTACSQPQSGTVNVIIDELPTGLFIYDAYLCHKNGVFYRCVDAQLG